MTYKMTIFFWKHRHIFFIDIVFSSVGHKLYYYTIIMLENLLIMAALIWYIPTMYHYMTNKMTFIVFKLSQMDYIDMILTSMVHEVCYETFLIWESLPNFASLMWFLPSVKAHVLFNTFKWFSNGFRLYIWGRGVLPVLIFYFQILYQGITICKHISKWQHWYGSSFLNIPGWISRKHLTTKQYHTDYFTKFVSKLDNKLHI